LARLGDDDGPSQDTYVQKYDIHHSNKNEVDEQTKAAMMEQQQPPLPASSSNGITIKEDEEAAAVVAVKSLAGEDEKIADEVAAVNIISPSPIFHVLLLPGAAVGIHDDDEENKPNNNVIIDDYLNQRHVYRKKAAARLGAAQMKSDEPTVEISLNLLASPLEIAMASCCVVDRQADNNKKLSSFSEGQSSSSSSTNHHQRSRLHRPILPSNAADDEHDGEVPLDTPRTISMKDPKQQYHLDDEINSNTTSIIGTLQQGQEGHFLKLLQMYCPQCKEGLMYRALAVEILQRTADWEINNNNNDDDDCIITRRASSNRSRNGASTSITKKDEKKNSSSYQDGTTTVGVGQIGYTFRKQFHSGWYVGKVTEILPHRVVVGSSSGSNSSSMAKNRRCVYTDGDEEDLSLDELKLLAELDELDRYHCDEDDGDGELCEEKKKNEADVDDDDQNNDGGGHSSGGVKKLKVEGGDDESTATETEVVATSPPPPPPPAVNHTRKSSFNEHTVMKTFLAVGGMKLLARWLVEAYTVVQPPPSSNPPNKKKSSLQKAETAVSPSPTGALLVPLLTLLKSIPFDKDIIVASSIHKYIKRYKKALDKLSKGINAESLNDFVHPIAGGGSVGKVMRGVEEVMTSWNNATAALSATAADDGSSEKDNKETKNERLDPYKELRDQLQSRFDELAAFHNNRTNPPEWVPKHVLGVVMASPKAAPSSPMSSKPTINATSSMKSNQPTKTNNEWGTNRASAAQLARERFLEGFRKRKEAVSPTTTTTTIAGLVQGYNKWTSSPPEKMQKIAHTDESSPRKVCWVDKPMGRRGVSPQPLVTEHVFLKEEEEYFEEEVENREMEMIRGDDGEDEDVTVQEDVVGNDEVDIVMEEVAKEDEEDSDLDDMF